MAPATASAKAESLIRKGRAARLCPDDVIALAEAALDGGREAEAEPIVSAAAARNPADARLWQWAGLVQRALDSHAEAIASFSKAARLAPHDPLLAHSLARVSLEGGLPATALFERAATLAPGDGEVLLGRAAARCSEGDSVAALAELDRVLAANSRWAAGHEAAMQLRWMEGARDCFTQSVERALAQMPRDVNLWRVALSGLIEAGMFERALAFAAAARRMVGDHLVVLANQAAALSELRRDAEADALFDRLLAVPDVSVAVRRIRHLLRTARVAQAAEAAERLTASPEANLVWPYLSLAWRILGDSRWEWLEAQPGLIAEIDISAALPPLDTLADTLRSLHARSGQPLDQSVRGGSQTDGNLFHRIDPIIRHARAAVTDAVKTYLAALPPKDAAHPFLRHRRDAPVRFSGAWSVRLSGGGHHANHNHPAGWISSALYVTLPPLAEDRAGWLVFGAPQRELGLDLPPLRSVEPRAGTLVLFPSWMWHGTLPFAAGERMTVAFDVAPPAP
jgi:tetratricopeptide (TPR) repeat protein